MALLDWLGLGGADAAPDDPTKKKPPAEDAGGGIDIMKAFGVAQDAANGTGAFGKGGTFDSTQKGDNKPDQSALDETAQAKKNLSLGFWASLFGK